MLGLRHIVLIATYSVDRATYSGGTASLKSKTTTPTLSERLIIKSADKGDVTVIMSVHFYEQMCMAELSKEDYYEMLGDRNPSKMLLRTVKEFCEKYELLLTKNEFNFLVKRKYRMAYFYYVTKTPQVGVFEQYPRGF